ncbi:Endonuclease/exonuclease/phosphatase [Pseudocohnilembus persalinus]|uniref:phosphoinositide 5-phosphatase n=1 Tax=Pseudocohnilembus persalinus TaxID=266149 RepID=A0A0V0R983_PSEPJ|nr:Endonuclease/exonuclease/phosphatase [Pseudocohnilembus persalinus]|eukprot:KRX11057.1 Endonuclease/exonuclease/phosphatase [Pseudocohnilembus persalinus]
MSITLPLFEKSLILHFSEGQKKSVFRKKIILKVGLEPAWTCFQLSFVSPIICKYGGYQGFPSLGDIKFGTIRDFQRNKLLIIKEILPNKHDNLPKQLKEYLQLYIQIRLFMILGVAPPHKKYFLPLEYLKIIPNKNYLHVNTFLKFDKITGRITELSQLQFKEISEKPLRQQYFSLLIGIIHIYDKPFLLFADKVKLIGLKQNVEIFEIQSVFFNNFELFSHGFYFSLEDDLTLTQQEKKKQQQQGIGLFEESNLNYKWNYYLQKDFQAQKISSRWQIPLIQGYYDLFQQHMNGKNIDYHLISRRSRYNSGTRYICRGIDDLGHVANFVETEQIVFFNNYMLSFVIARGSCPLFWSQQSSSSSTKLMRNYDMTHLTFIKHFKNLNQQYGRIFCLNLMNKSKSNEQLLIENFEQHIQEAVEQQQLQDVRYNYFDFNQNYVSKAPKQDKINSFVGKHLFNIAESLGFFVKDLEVQCERGKDDIVWQQSGIFRINCLNTLEKTDHIQMKIAMLVLKMQFQKMGIDLSSQNAMGTDPIDALDNPKNVHPFLVIFKNIWLQQQEKLESHYSAGNNAKNATVLKNKGFYNFLEQQVSNFQKYYSNSFEDQTKQESIDLILGEHNQICNIFDQQINGQLKKQVKDFCDFKPISVYVTSWNMNGKIPKLGSNLMLNLFKFEGELNPDIVVIGLQEMVKLNTKNVIMTNNNDKITNQWKMELQNSLKLVDDYVMISERDLVGIYIIVFVKSSIKQNVSKIESCEIKTGYMGGTFGNKGGCLVRMKVHDSSFCFICCHLDSGQSKIQERLQSIQEIHQKGFGSQRKEFHFSELDYCVFFGDMNFRLKENNLTVRQKLSLAKSYEHKGEHEKSQRIINDLLEHDQLIEILRGTSTNSVLRFYKEDQIKFQPTYKYDLGTDVYDTSKKFRTPSWTDRILLKPARDLKWKIKFYKRFERLESDHRPIGAYYQLQVKIIDQSKLDEAKKDIYNKATNQTGINTLNIDEIQQLTDNHEIQESKEKFPDIQNCEKLDQMNQYQQEREQESDQKRKKSENLANFLHNKKNLQNYRKTYDPSKDLYQPQQQQQEMIKSNKVQFDQNEQYQFKYDDQDNKFQKQQQKHDALEFDDLQDFDDLKENQEEENQQLQQFYNLENQNNQTKIQESNKMNKNNQVCQNQNNNLIYNCDDLI